MYYTSFQYGICLQCGCLYIAPRIWLDKYYTVKTAPVYGIGYDYNYLHFSAASCTRAVVVTLATPLTIRNSSLGCAPARPQAKNLGSNHIWPFRQISAKVSAHSSGTSIPQTSSNVPSRVYHNAWPQIPKPTNRTVEK